jgi:hypothetical protein
LHGFLRYTPGIHSNFNSIRIDATAAYQNFQRQQNSVTTSTVSFGTESYDNNRDASGNITNVVSTGAPPPSPQPFTSTFSVLQSAGTGLSLSGSSVSSIGNSIVAIGMQQTDELAATGFHNGDLETGRFIRGGRNTFDCIRRNFIIR